MEPTAERCLAAAQTTPRRGDLEANLAEHLALARAAARERVQVLVFPELSLTGYELDLAPELAFGDADPRLASLRELSSRSSMTMIVGAPVRLESGLFIGAFIVSPDGALGLYTKQHLGAFPSDVNPGGPVPPAEASVFQAGERNPLLRFGGSTAAVAVCADTGRASHAEAAAERGAECYLASMFVIPADLEQDRARLRAYAVRHALTVVMANYGGPSGGLPSGGRSAIWSKRGDLLVEMATVGSGLAVARERAARWQGYTVPRPAS